VQWLNSEDKQSTNNPIILKEFVNNKRIVLYDNTLNHDVIVETYKGVPNCRGCKADDCEHVGSQYFLSTKYDNEIAVWTD
jgi:hypothetical protein